MSIDNISKSVHKYACLLSSRAQYGCGGYAGIIVEIRGTIGCTMKPIY